MAYDKNNEVEYNSAGAPKKADIIIKSTQDIASKQDEISEQTRLAVSRMNEAIEMFSQNNTDAQYIVKQSGEIFEQLQSENSALKQELLYLAKQSENIYAGLAEKINELADSTKARAETLEGLSYKLNDVSEQAVAGNIYAEIIDRLAEIAEQNRRNERMIDALNERLDGLSDKIQEASAQPVIVEQPDKSAVEVDNTEVMNKLEAIAEQLRRNEGAHSMLADKFEILSMRVEQFGFESTKSAPQNYAQPVVYAAPGSADIDYDKLAAKVAELVSAHEVISPDYIASKVAEQIVLPEVEASNVKLSIDEENIARQVAQLIDGKLPRDSVQPVNIDEEKLADSIAQRVGAVQTAPLAVEIDEEKLADSIAKKVGVVQSAPVPADINVEELADSIAKKVGGISVAGANISIDEEELADAIAIKVGSLKSEDFEILVDDDGCTSISQEIANKLDYNVISNIIADKLRASLDLAAANAPDYEEMAERISEKITVAGVNEDAIADKAAAVLSNYLPEFDTDEIADKVTGAVIDVVSAMPQPTVDNEAICNIISERLIESQENHDYDIVIDEDGIYKITELISQEIEKQTGERLEKMEEAITSLTDSLDKEVEVEEELATASEEEEVAETEDAILPSELITRLDSVDKKLENIAELLNGEEVYEEEIVEEGDVARTDISALKQALADEIEKSVASRFDSVEEKLENITELMNSEEYDEETELEDGEVEEDDISVLTEAFAAEIEKSVSSRLDSVEQKLNDITELMTGEGEYAEELEGEEEAEAVEEDYTDITSAVADEIEKRVSSRFDSMEEKLNNITELMTGEDEYAEELEGEEQVEAVEEDYTDITSAVADEIEKRVSSRFDSVEEKLNSLTEFMSVEDEYEEAEESGEPAEEDYTRLSEAVADEIDKRVTARLDSLEENVAKITLMVASGIDVQSDDTNLRDIVAAELEKGLNGRFDKVEEDLAKIAEYVEGDIPVETDGRLDKIAEDVAKIATYIEGEVSVETDARFEKIREELEAISNSVLAPSVDEERISKVEDGIAEIKEMLASGVSIVTESQTDAEQTVKMEETLAEIKEMLASGVSVLSDDSDDEEQANKIEETLAEIKEMLSKGATVTVDEVKEGYQQTTPDDVLTEIKEMLAGGIVIANSKADEDEEEKVNRVEYVLTEIRDLLAADLQKDETASSATEAVHDDELVTVRDLVDSEMLEAAEHDDDDDDDFLIDVLDMDKFSDDELMPGEMSEFGGVDFANMMKYKRSFIARIIQSNDEYKQYYGEVKHALLSYKKVNSNVAWGAERFSKGRETIARLKIRGKTLCLYLALDPNEYKISVYHHIDVSENKSVSGTPMMVKIKSNLGVRKAIRLIDEMLAARNGEKKEIPERNYAAMYPYENIEELIEDGLVKDVRKK